MVNIKLNHGWIRHILQWQEANFFDSSRPKSDVGSKHRI